MSTSPARAGLAAVTGEKSAWNTAGPLAVVTISGQDSGIRETIQCPRVPPFTRLFAGSSCIGVGRVEKSGLAGAVPLAPW